MKKLLPLVFTILILTGISGVQYNSVFAQTTNDLPEQIHAPDRLMVKFNPGVSESSQSAVLSSHSASVIDHLPLLDIKIISVPEPVLDAVKNALSKNNSVEYAEYDFAVPSTTIPNDTNYGNQWHLPKINAPGAYDITHGDVFPIVILDSGIDMDHSDLASQIIYPYNGLTLVAGPVDHVNNCGHGTPVAGSAAAITNNANGIAGVGWDTQIIPVKITNDNAAIDGTQCYGWSNGVLRGVEWAVSHGAKVVNLSYGFDGSSGQIQSAAQLLRDNDGWLVISAGNDYGQVSKTDDSRIIFVSSTTSSDNLSGFSSYGNYVDMSGPGSGIHTTINGNSYGGVSGTSFAAPITASVLNLIYSVDPTLTSSEAFDILKNSAVDLGAPGWDNQFGYGRVDAEAAVLAASGTQSLTPEVPPVNFKVAFLGDQGSNTNSEAVLQLIATENADMALHQGDFDYGDNPTFWNNQINAFLGPSFPYFASVGNHDVAQWSGYQQKLQERLALIPGAVCTGDLGVNSSCHYQGLFFILSGVGTLGSGHETYIQNELAADDSIWSICSWHKNQNAMQVGGKNDEVGWGAYEACRQGGAIIATAHEHSYERTKTLTSTTNQVIDPAWTDPNEVRVAEGSTFAFVSGLGGQSIRDQLRCTPTSYPYGCVDEWASIYTSSQGAQPGALFCEFNVNGQADKATCYFKNISGQTIDSFNITSFMGVDIPQEPPISYNQSVSIYENIPIDLTLSATDANGDSLTFSIVSGPTNGSLFGAAPNLTYSPNLGYTGSDSFTFKANDGTVDSNTATVSITVDAIPTSGTLNIRVNSSSDDAEQRITSGVMDITSTDIEIGDDPGHNENQLGGLRFQDIVIPRGATILSAYVEFETDDIDTAITSVIISAQDHDNAPTFTTASNNISDRTTTTALVSWSDIPAWNTVSEKHNTPDISSLVQEIIDRSGWNPGNSMAFIIDGTGSRTAESYDGESINAALLHLEYTTITPNNPPTANAGADQNVNEDTFVNLSGSGTDSDGTITTYAWTQTAGTTVILTGDDTTTPSFTAPSVGLAGETLIFSLIVTDNDGTDSTADTVDIIVADVPVPNTPPVADDQNVITAEDTLVNITLTGSDVESSITFNVETQPSSGSLSGVEPNLTYTPNGNYTGPDSFTFTANDGTVDSNIATVSITVTPVNDAPLAQDDSDTTNQNSAVIIDVLSNDSDIDGDSLSVTGTANLVGGTAVVNPGNSITYTPNSGFIGIGSFSYSISDGNGGFDTASVTVNVIALQEAHVGDLEASKTGKKNWNARITISVHSNIHTSLSGMTVSGDWSGGFTGPDSCVTDSIGECLVTHSTKNNGLTFTISGISGNGVNYDGSANHDSNFNSDGTSITINKDGSIPGPNLPPTANDDSATATQGQPVSINVLTNDTDPNGDALTIQSVTQGSQGIVTINSQTVTYTPGAASIGLDSFSYTISDGNGGIDSATVSVTINELPPVTKVHVGSLVSELSSKGPWNTGTVIIGVYDSGDILQSGVTVFGTWTGLFSGDDSCTTNESGTCSVSDRSRDSGTVTFTVNDMSGNGFEYDSEATQTSFISFTIP